MVPGGRKNGLPLDLRSPIVQALLALVFMVGVGCVFHADGAFFKAAVHRGLWKEISIAGILACGMTVVIVTAGIDLAVGSVLALTSVSFALFTIPHGWGPIEAILACLGIGLATGVVSGSLVAFFRIQPFIVTLAMMVFARGLAKAFSGGKKVNTAWGKEPGESMSTELPPIFEQIDSLKKWVGIGTPVTIH